MQEVVPLLVSAGIEATRSEEKRGTVIALREIPTGDATDATAGENLTGKPDVGGDTASLDAAANAIDGPNATADATPNPADRVEGGISGIRSGNFSAPVPSGAEPSEEAAVAELEARRATLSGEGERRVRRLVRERMAEGWALREVLASGHTLDCECGVCR